jgi:hypothetical protein
MVNLSKMRFLDAASMTWQLAAYMRSDANRVAFPRPYAFACMYEAHTVHT